MGAGGVSPSIIYSLKKMKASKITLTNRTKEKAQNFVNKLKLFTLAESLGGVESLVCHPASMTHASIPHEKREKIGIVDGLVRLSVGIEDSEDLFDDIINALNN